MSDHNHPHESDKAAKKRKQREKNRRDWIFFNQVAQMRENVDIGTPSTKREHKPADKTKPTTTEDKPWSAKLTSIRNRLDNSRRVSDDRWNRFAGTSDGGGRGR